MAQKRFYGKKAAKPSRTDMATNEIEANVLKFWRDMASKKLNEFEYPWLTGITSAENAGKFLTTGDRYVYKGGMNQFLVALYAWKSQKSNDRNSQLMLTRSDMNKIFDVKDFADSPVVQNHIKSTGSLYGPPVDKTVGKYWAYPDGSRWGGSKPTAAQIAKHKLDEKKLKSKVFTSFPVWSVADVGHLFDEEHKQKLDELIKLRSPVNKDHGKYASLDELIDSKLNDIVARQGIKVSADDHTNSCYYSPMEDLIVMPIAEQFKNPIARYGAAIHELTHSTGFLLGRNLGSRSKIDYAKEEIVAESVAYLMVKELEEELAEGKEMESEIAGFFEKFYSNSSTYQAGWGGAFDLDALVDQIEIAKQKDKRVIKTILVDIAKAAESLRLNEYEPSARAEMVQKGLDKVKAKSGEVLESAMG